MFKLFLSWIMKTLFLLAWDIWVPLGLLISSGSQSCWIQPLISKVRAILLIIICDIEVVKGNQL